jgi:hypothetical protein
MALDRQAVVWIITANLMAASMLYQRLDKQGYIAPLKHRAHDVLEEWGLVAPSHAPCGLLPNNTTRFILTSSRVVHPHGVRPGAGERASTRASRHGRCGPGGVLLCAGL